MIQHDIYIYVYVYGVNIYIYLHNIYIYIYIIYIYIYILISRTLPHSVYLCVNLPRKADVPDAPEDVRDQAGHEKMVAASSHRVASGNLLPFAIEKGPFSL